MSICAPSPWSYHQLMNMHDHFTYCVTLATQPSLKEALAQAFSTRYSTAGKWCLIRFQTEDQGKCFEIDGKTDLFQS